MKIMLLGSGPERIGKTGELDRMANQAIEFLIGEGHEIVYVDSNPNCIASMHRKGVVVYMEPLTLACLENIINKEKPESIVYSFGGRLSTHLTMLLEREGILDKYGVRVLGTPVYSLKRILEEEIFINKLAEHKIQAVKLRNCRSKEDCIETRGNLGIPLIMRASFALEGEGGYLAYNDEEIKNISPKILSMSPVRQIILERVMDDYIQVAMECFIDNTINKTKVYLISTFETIEVGYNSDLGNSVVVSPSLTLKGDLLNKAFNMAAKAAAILEISGSYEVRFWYSVNTKDIYVRRLIPSVTRFSSFGSLVRGIPVGEMNLVRYLGLPITEYDTRKLTISGLEQELDDENKKAIRIPEFSEELQVTKNLKTVMSATGARIFLGKTNEELMGKAVDWAVKSSIQEGNVVPDKLAAKDIVRLLQENRFNNDDGEGENSASSDINPTFFVHAEKIAELYNITRSFRGQPVSPKLRKNANDLGFSNEVICLLTEEVKKRKDTNSSLLNNLSLPEKKNAERKIAGTLDSKEKAVLVLGPGPYSIGWGPEIEIALVQALSKLKACNWKIILLNDNPDGLSLESTLFDAVCVEPVTIENLERAFSQYSITDIIHQFCSCIPIELPELLNKRNIRTIGTPISSMMVLRNVPMLWKELMNINISLLPYAFQHEKEEILRSGTSMGYPLLVRLTNRYINPVAGIVYDKKELNQFIVSHGKYVSKEKPLFMEKFEEGLIGAEILAIGDGEEACVLRFLEHIEEYGVHSDDCASIIPTWSIGDHQLAIAEEALSRIVNHFNLIGHIKLSLAIRGCEVFVTGVSPYPARNILFLEKTAVQPVHNLVAEVFSGANVKKIQDLIRPVHGRCYVKESVFPFKNFSNFDPVLAPRMISIGQVMGQDENFGKAFLKAQIAINPIILKNGRVFLSGRDNKKEAILQIAEKLVKLGFHLASTQGTAQFLLDRGLKVDTVYKVSEWRPNIRDLIINEKISLLINIPGGSQSKKDEELIRRAAIDHNVPLFTTISGALLMVRGIEELRKHEFIYNSLYTED
jgi:carbamoyl-phosphate synthase large subunit